MRIANTLSSLAYVLPGLTHWIEHGFGPIPFACIFLLAPGSALFHYFFDHAKHRAWSHHLDELGMYTTFSAIALEFFGLGSWLVVIPVWIGMHFAARRFGSGEVLPLLAVAIASSMLTLGLRWELLLVVGIFFGAYKIRSHRHVSGEFGPLHWMWHVWTVTMIAVLVHYAI